VGDIDGQMSEGCGGGVCAGEIPSICRLIGLPIKLLLLDYFLTYCSAGKF